MNTGEGVGAIVLRDKYTEHTSRTLAGSYFAVSVLLAGLLHVAAPVSVAFPREPITNYLCPNEWCPAGPQKSLDVSLSVLPAFEQFKLSPVKVVLPCDDFDIADFNGNGRDEIICPPRTAPESASAAENNAFTTFELQADGTWRPGQYPLPSDAPVLEVDWPKRAVGNIDLDRFSELFVAVKGRTDTGYLLIGGAQHVVQFPILNGNRLAKIDEVRFVDAGCEESALLFEFLGPSTDARYISVMQHAMDRAAHELPEILRERFDLNFRAHSQLTGGCSGEVTWSPHGFGLVLSHVGPPYKKQIAFPEVRDWRYIGTGDFVGSGYPQFLFYSDPLNGWWIVSLQSKEPYFRPLTGLPRALEKTATVTAGDLNGDRRTDLVFTEDGVKTLYLSNRGTPISGRLVSLSDGRSALTDIDGIAHFSPGLLKGDAVNVSGPVPDSRTLTRRDSQLDTLNFVFTECHMDADPQGSAGQRRQVGCSPVDGPPVPGPYVCMGMTHVLATSDRGFLECPSGYYVFGVDDARVTPHGGAPVMTCCPLPDRSLLTEPVDEPSGQCGPNKIVTGVKFRAGATAYPLPVRCSALDEKRARLGPPTVGRYFGPRSRLPMARAENPPVALQEALGRLSVREYDVDGCVGQPWGSALTGLSGNGCDRMEFTQLLDLQGAPLQVYPECTALTSHNDPRAGCR